MPITPRAPQDRVQQAPLPGLRTGVSAPVEAFGGGREAEDVHQEIQGGLGEAERIAQEEKYQADQIAVMKQAAALTAEQTRLLYHPKTGALNRRGENAFGAPKEVNESWQKTVTDLEKGLVGDRQKMAFRRMALDKQGDIDRALQQHVSVEKRRYDDDTTKAFVGASSNAAVEAYGDPMEVTKQLTTQDAALRDYARRSGMSPDATNQLINETQSRTVRDVIFRALEKGEDIRAKEYLEAGARDFLKGDDLVKVEQAVDKWSTAGRATRLIDGFMAEATSFKELMGKARGIKEDGVRAEAERYAKTRWAEHEFEQREAKNARFTNAYAAIDNSGDQAESPEQAVGPTIWTSITDGKDREELTKAWRIKRGLEAPSTDNAVYYALKTMGANEDTRAEFLSENLLRYRSKLTQQDFQELANFQAGLINKDSKATKEAEGYLSKEQTINQMAETIKDKGQRVEFKTFIDGEIRRWQQGQPDPKKLPPKDEIEKMMRDVIKEKGGYFGLGKSSRVFSAPTNAELMDVENRKQDALQAIAAQDPAEIPKIIEALERNKIPVTPERILELYEKGKVTGGR